MRAFTETRDEATPDEFWLLEHASIYTLGLNGSREHLLQSTATPVIQTDRGGQITWHGPGQLVIYTLIDLRRRSLGIRTLIRSLESSVIHVLRSYGLRGEFRPDAPGVYIDNRKIASVGLRVVRGCSYHGLSLNVNPDLDFFTYINPCGFAGLQTTSLAALGIESNCSEIAVPLTTALINCLGYEPDKLIAAA